MIVIVLAVTGVLLLVFLLILITEGRYAGKGLIRWTYNHIGPALFQMESEADRWRDLAARLGLRGNKTLLDVGTAVGDLPLTVVELDRFSGQVYGVDWSPRMIEAAQLEAERRGIEARTQFLVVDVRDGLPFEADRFDVVCCIGLLETWPHPERILAELVRVLKPGGTLVVSLYRGWWAWGGRLSLNWYRTRCAALGLEQVEVIPSRTSQDLVLAK